MDEHERPKNTDLITIDDGFEAMRFFLEAYWKRGGKHSDDIAVLLGSLNRNERNINPLDPAQWQDWLAAVSKVRTLS